MVLQFEYPIYLCALCADKSSVLMLGDTDEDIIDDVFEDPDGYMKDGRWVTTKQYTECGHCGEKTYTVRHMVWGSKHYK